MSVARTCSLRSATAHCSRCSTSRTDAKTARTLTACVRQATFSPASTCNELFDPASLGLSFFARNEDDAIRCMLLSHCVPEQQALETGPTYRARAVCPLSNTWLMQHADRCARIRGSMITCGRLPQRTGARLTTSLLFRHLVGDEHLSVPRAGGSSFHAAQRAGENSNRLARVSGDKFWLLRIFVVNRQELSTGCPHRVAYGGAVFSIALSPVFLVGCTAAEGIRAFPELFARSGFQNSNSHPCGHGLDRPEIFRISQHVASPPTTTR